MFFSFHPLSPGLPGGRRALFVLFVLPGVLGQPSTKCCCCGQSDIDATEVEKDRSRTQGMSESDAQFTRNCERLQSTADATDIPICEAEAGAISNYLGDAINCAAACRSGPGVSLVPMYDQQASLSAFGKLQQQRWRAAQVAGIPGGSAWTGAVGFPGSGVGQSVHDQEGNVPRRAVRKSFRCPRMRVV